jgi:hypothetical protein
LEYGQDITANFQIFYIHPIDPISEEQQRSVQCQLFKKLKLKTNIIISPGIHSRSEKWPNLKSFSHSTDMPMGARNQMHS